MNGRSAYMYHKATIKQDGVRMHGESVLHLFFVPSRYEVCQDILSTRNGYLRPQSWRYMYKYLTHLLLEFVSRQHEARGRRARQQSDDKCTAINDVHVGTIIAMIYVLFLSVWLLLVNSS